VADYPKNPNYDVPPGDFAAALRGEKSFAIGQLLQRAWDITLRSLPMLLIAGVVVILISMVVGSLVEALLPTSDVVVDDSGEVNWASISWTNIVLSNLINQAILAPFVAMLVLIGLRNGADLKTNFGQLKQVFASTPQLVLIVIVTTAIMVVAAATLVFLGSFVSMVLGFTLMALVLIYFQIAFTLAVPLVLDRGLSAWRAIIASLLVINKQMWRVLGLYLVMWIIMFISALPLGLGLLFTIPMLYNLNGVLYHTLIGCAAAEGQAEVVVNDHQ